MTSVGKKIIGSTLSGLLIASSAAVGIAAISSAPGNAPSAYAAEKSTAKKTATKTKTPYMKSLKLKWDLKQNKTVKSNQKIAGVGSKPMKISVKNFKTKKLKNGQKKTTFTLVYDRAFVPTKKQVHKMAAAGTSKYGGAVVGGYFYAVTDYSTGKSLEDDSALAQELGVKVTRTEWKRAKDKTYRDGDDCWVYFSPKISTKVTITYPADYKGLCLGVGAYPYMKLSSAAEKANDLFWSGEKTFGSTAIYKKSKTNSHWMRIK